MKTGKYIENLILHAKDIDEKKFKGKSAYW
jgi:hypothetical protein